MAGVGALGRVAVGANVVAEVGVAVSVGFGALVLAGVTVFVGVDSGCSAAHDTLPRAHAPSCQIVATSILAIAPLKVLMRSLKYSDPVVPSAW
jgi:hypothetical protein